MFTDSSTATLGWSLVCTFRSNQCTARLLAATCAWTVSASFAAQALGGRLRPGADLRKSGTVRYNGPSTDESCVERAIGVVDQYDDREYTQL